jgi:hypothetical protein
VQPCIGADTATSDFVSAENRLVPTRTLNSVRLSKTCPDTSIGIVSNVRLSNNGRTLADELSAVSRSEIVAGY